MVAHVLALTNALLPKSSKADNPIVFASDGFIKVTGYQRSEVIPRNCRFLQRQNTDKTSVLRLKTAIDNRQESVELLLNFKKNGEPFWNLLYVCPLFRADGSLAFFLGGQINCSTTIHNNADVMRILAASSDMREDTQSADHASGPNKSHSSSNAPPVKRESGFGSLFKSFKSSSGNRSAAKIATLKSVREAGLEDGLLGRIENLDLKNQMNAFYTAYSKVCPRLLVMIPTPLPPPIPPHSPTSS